MNWIEDFKKIILNDNPDLAALIDFKNNYIPKKLYQYTRFKENKIKSLKDSKIWAGNPIYLNDPYDCHIFIEEGSIRRKSLYSLFSDISHGNIDEIMNRIDSGENPRKIVFEIFDPNNIQRNNSVLINHVDSFMEEALASTIAGINDIYKDLRGNFGVSSFSERVDSILMWSHYTQDHQGFCVEYDFTEHPIKEYIFPVIYQNEVFECSCVLDRNSDTKIIIAVLVKAQDWSYEREWRLVLPKKENIGKGLAVDSPTPKAIYLGSHVIEENENIMKNICIEKNIPLYKMVHSLNEFKMIPTLIT